MTGADFIFSCFLLFILGGALIVLSFCIAEGNRINGIDPWKPIPQNIIGIILGIGGFVIEGSLLFMLLSALSNYQL